NRSADHEASARCLVVGVDWIGAADVSSGASDPCAQAIEEPGLAGVTCDQVNGVHRSSLADAIDPRDWLFEPDRIPRQLEVDDGSGDLMEVEALAGRIRRQENCAPATCECVERRVA